MVFKRKNIDIELIKDLHLKGHSFLSISRLMKVSPETIRRRAIEEGLEPNFKKLVPMTEKEGKFLCTKCLTYKNKNDFIYRIDGRLRFKFCKTCKQRQWNDMLAVNYKSYIGHATSQIKHRAKISGMEFDLDKEFLIHLWDKQNGKCFYTDKQLDINNKYYHNHSSPSLDRVIPSKGYVKGNVVWSIQRINVMKNDATLDEMKIWMPDWHRRIVNGL